ncbi:MAG: hypothetical protein Q8P52_00400 [bacterium]|nr:hypothetical protein [bacterium]
MAHSFFKKHKAIFFLTSAVAVLYGFHHLFFYIEAGKNSDIIYAPTIIGIDEKYHTIARAKEVYLTGRASGDISLYEYQGSPTVSPPAPHYILGFLARLFGSVNVAFIFSSVFFPAMAFLVLYFLFYELFSKRLLSIAFASLSLILPRYLSFFPPLDDYGRAWFFSHLVNPQYRLYFNRFEDPMLTAVFFFVALYLLVRAFKRNERWMPYLAGIAVGFLLYVYFYYAVYTATALFFIVIASLFLKEKKILKIALVVFAVSALMVVPYFINFYELTRLPGYKDISIRIGPEHTFKPFFYPRVLFAYFQHTALAALLFWLFRKKDKFAAIFLVSLLLPVFIVYNIQVVTGFNPQPDHWIKPRQFVLNMAFFALALALFQKYKEKLLPLQISLATAFFSGFFLARAITTENSKVKIYSLVLAFFLALLVLGLMVLSRKGKFNAEKVAEASLVFAIAFLFLKGVDIERRYISSNLNGGAFILAEEFGSYEWIRENTPKDSVIGTPSFVSNTLLKHFTDKKIYVPDGYDTVAANDEIADRFFQISKVYGIGEGEFGRFFATGGRIPENEDRTGISYLFADQFRAEQPGVIFTNRGYGFPVWSGERHSAFVRRYEDFLKSGKTLPYKLDYLYFGEREKAIARDPAKLNTDLEIVYDANGIKIYKLPGE